MSLKVRFVKRGGKILRRNIQESYPINEYSLSYSTNVVYANGKKYILNYPLRSHFEKEDGYLVINNEQLDIISTGLTEEEVKLNFGEEFDFLYSRLSTLDESQLTKRMLRIKATLFDFVKEVQ